MDFIENYIDRAEEIIGERTNDEKKYDKEVIRWLHKGKPIRKAISKANQKYPREALTVSDDGLEDVKSHYEYMAKHESLMKQMNRIGVRDNLKEI